MPVLQYFDGERWIDISGGGSGGTSDYTSLSNKPSINGVTLSGSKTSAQLSLAPASHSHAQSEITGLINSLSGKVNEPASEGTDGQVLTTDGNGGRSWTGISGAQLTPYPASGGLTAGTKIYIGTAAPSAAIASAIGEGNLYVQVQNV